MGDAGAAAWVGMGGSVGWGLRARPRRSGMGRAAARVADSGGAAKIGDGPCAVM